MCIRDRFTTAFFLVCLRHNRCTYSRSRNTIVQSLVHKATLIGTLQSLHCKTLVRPTYSFKTLSTSTYAFYLWKKCTASCYLTTNVTKFAYDCAGKDIVLKVEDDEPKYHLILASYNVIISKAKFSILHSFSKGRKPRLRNF